MIGHKIIDKVVTEEPCDRHIGFIYKLIIIQAIASILLITRLIDTKLHLQEQEVGQSNSYNVDPCGLDVVDCTKTKPISIR